MGVTTAQLREAIGDRLRAIDALTVYDYVPDRINAPAAVVVPTGSADQTQARGFRVDEFEIRLFVQGANLRQGEIVLDELLDVSGDGSVFAAFDGDRTLGLSGVDVAAVAWSEYGRLEVAGTDYLTSNVSLIVDRKKTP